MAKSKRHPIRQSAVKAALANPLYRQRVVRDRTKYNRNDAKNDTFHNASDEILDEPLDRFDAEYGDCEGSFEDVPVNLFQTVFQKTLVVTVL